MFDICSLTLLRKVSDLLSLMLTYYVSFYNCWLNLDVVTWKDSRCRMPFRSYCSYPSAFKMIEPD